MANGTLVEVVDGNFQREVLEAELPVLVDFWATWCGPCKALTPVMEELAKIYAGRLKIVKCNVESCGEVPQNYLVSMLPTLLFFKQGQVAETVVGAPTKAKLEATIQKVLG